MTELEICKLALNEYGETMQTNMAIGALAKLQKALKNKIKSKALDSSIAEDIAEVEIMLTQMKILYGCMKGADQAKQAKLNRMKKKLSDNGRTA